MSEAAALSGTATADYDVERRGAGAEVGGHVDAPAFTYRS